MSGSFDITTVVFAILAVFVVWKLRSVLGTRTGTERPPFDPFARRSAAKPPSNVVPLPGSAERREDRGRQDSPAPFRWEGFAEPGSAVAAGLETIAKADPAFAPAPFMSGARGAYETIITAFAKGDRATLTPLLARDVSEGFLGEINRREGRGDKVETTFVSIDGATIEDAQLRGRSAQIAVRFLTKLITVTRDRAGQVIDGDPERVGAIIDVWTFARSIDSRDPNWMLVATETGQ